MTDLEAPPQAKRKRWRWLLLTSLVVLILSAWLFWRSGDARFVGTWAMVDTSGQRIGTLWLNRFGLNSLKQMSPGRPPTRREYFLYWEVKNGLLLLGNRSGEFSTASGRLIRAAARIPGATFLSGVHAYELTKVADTGIELRSMSVSSGGPDIGTSVWLRRIPE